jgi:gamma-glutamyltranspeptidase/glutathione hydrolase
MRFVVVVVVRNVPSPRFARFAGKARRVCVALALLLSSSSQAATPRPATGKQGMAASAHPEATKAALTILQAGGNAVDAAVAAAFAISVVEPFSAGIGGGGFAVSFNSKTMETKALDFREVAPKKATRGMYVDDKGAVVQGRSVDGWLSVAVPGVVPGLFELHKAQGQLPWANVLRPAIDLASKGFVVGDAFVDSVAARADALRTAGSDPVFQKLVVGATLVQPDLATTLQAIANNPRAMHDGPIGKTIASEMKAHGGLITEADLKAYRPTWRTPLCGPYKGLTLCTMPPPSSGGVHLLQILRLLDGSDLKAGGWHDVNNTSRLIEAMRTAFADRAVWLGDPAFVDVPVAQLTSTAYAELRRKEIDPLHARQSSNVKAGTPEQLGLRKGSAVPPMKKQAKKESADTSHLTVVDADRNAVSLTFTVNYRFGSGVVVKGTGILLNDEMDDFAAAPGVMNSYGLVGGEANAVAPGKIPLSSMTPLIATKDGRFVLTAGAPGGSTIITTTLQTVLHVVDFGMDAQAAVTAPRIHQQWMPEATRIERLGFDAPTQQALEARGFTFDVREGGWGNAMCIVQRADGTLEGGADPRGEGSAAGF